MQRVLLGFCLYIINLMGYAQTICSKPFDYDLTITPEYVQTYNATLSLIISPTGDILYNQKPLPISAETRKKAIEYQNFTRERLYIIEYLAYIHIADLTEHFTLAIRQKLGDKSPLLLHLDQLQISVTKLLKKTIYKKEGKTQFHHQTFNQLYRDSKQIIMNTAATILSESLRELRLYNNISVLKSLAKHEWQEKKAGVKEFNQYICNTLTLLDYKRENLLKSLSSTP